MRFKKGSKVEVLCNRDVPSGEWRCAEIISGNGHTYSVRYDCSSIKSEAVVERVPRKVIRRCPPLVKGAEDWAANDVMEVYDINSWKGAIILKFLGDDHYLVRLIGSCKEFQVHKSDMRARQLWQDGQWIVMQKGAGYSGVGKSIRNFSLNSYKMTPEVQQSNIKIKQQDRNDCFPGQDENELQESRPVSSTTLKRPSPYWSSPVEEYPRKMRVMVSKQESQRFVAVSPPLLLEKVDAVAYPHKNMGEKCMHASYNNEPTQYHEMGKENPNNVIKYFHERCKETIDSDSDECSVGSCSVISNDSSMLSSYTLAGPYHDADTLCSDAESLDVGDAEDRCPPSPKKDVAARIHRLELHAYRKTLEAMYASDGLNTTSFYYNSGPVLEACKPFFQRLKHEASLFPVC
ncbi:hypothetical protein L6164_024291 [Bauhinia variegata]|uniref:Uncharacterized protein n=1 Tax=Bauhinia variegata TaxID=167791 RepID=A0ACB9LXC3_BAUVA|nr:hypothetical protein L6164_024291 [Bauhinia variegata]